MAKAKVVDPTGRVDLLAIRALEWYAETQGGMAEAAVYRRFKREINSSLRRYLGPLRFNRTQLQALAQAVMAQAQEQPQARTEAQEGRTTESRTV